MKYRALTTMALASLLMSLLATGVFGYALFSDVTIDIHQHDTYYVLALSDAITPLVGLLGFEAVVYHLFRGRNGKRWLAGLHVASCIVFCIFLLLPDALLPEGPAFSRPLTYFEWTPSLTQLPGQYPLTAFLSLLFLAGQLAFTAQIALLLFGRRSPVGTREIPSAR